MTAATTALEIFPAYGRIGSSNFPEAVNVSNLIAVKHRIGAEKKFHT